MKIFCFFTLWVVLCLPSFAGAQSNSEAGELQTAEGTVCGQFQRNIAQNQKACHDAAKNYLASHKNIPIDPTDFKTYKLDFMENICSQAKYIPEHFWYYAPKAICLDQAAAVAYGVKVAKDQSIACIVYYGNSIVKMSEEYEKCMTENLEKTRPGHVALPDILDHQPNSKTIRGS